MRDLTKPERAAIEAVAARFSATWEEGRGSADACLVVAGKRVGVGIATLGRRRTAPRNAAKPRLRFDRVATGVVTRLQAALDGSVPVGTTVVLTVTAPIRVPSQTAAALEEKIQGLLGRRSPGGDVKATVHGNGVRLRLVRHKSERAPKVIGFVHNPDSDPLLLLNMTREWLELVGREPLRSATRLAGDRWLVVISAVGSACLDAYRYIHSQLPAVTGFKKIVMVFGDGRVGILAE